MKHIFKKGSLLILLLATSLAGCASDKLRQATATFGTTTISAISKQVFELDVYNASVQEALFTRYAKEGTRLRYTSECSAAVSGELSKDQVKACKIVTSNGKSSAGTPIKNDNLLKLAAALGGYAQALSVLSGDFDDDSTAFLTAITSVASSIMTLDGQLAEVSGNGKGRIDKKKSGALVNLIAAVTNARFQVERDRALVSLIKTTDHHVQTAVPILSEYMKTIREARIASSYLVLHNAVMKHNEAFINKVRGQKLRRINNAIFKAYREYKIVLAIKNPFPAIGEAHAALVKASETGFSSKDYKIFIEHIIELAENTQAFVSTF